MTHMYIAKHQVLFECIIRLGSLPWPELNGLYYNNRHLCTFFGITLKQWNKDAKNSPINTTSELHIFA